MSGYKKPMNASMLNMWKIKAGSRFKASRLQSIEKNGCGSKAEHNKDIFGLWILHKPIRKRDSTTKARSGISAVGFAVPVK